MAGHKLWSYHQNAVLCIVFVQSSSIFLKVFVLHMWHTLLSFMATIWIMVSIVSISILLKPCSEYPSPKLTSNLKRLYLWGKTSSEEIKRFTLYYNFHTISNITKAIHMYLIFFYWDLVLKENIGTIIP